MLRVFFSCVSCPHNPVSFEAKARSKFVITQKIFSQIFQYFMRETISSSRTMKIHQVFQGEAREALYLEILNISGKHQTIFRTKIINKLYWRKN